MRERDQHAAMEEERSAHYREVMDKCAALTHGRNLLVEGQAMLFKAGVGSGEQVAALSRELHAIQAKFLVEPVVAGLAPSTHECSLQNFRLTRR